MVALQFSCPRCAGMFQVDSSMSGQQVACPHCRGVVALPEGSGSESALRTPPSPAAASHHPQSVPIRPPTRPAGPARPHAVPRPIPAAPAKALAEPGGGPLRVREPVKTVGRGEEAVELRTLSPEEKARRKLRKNLVLWAFCLLIIGITLALLLITGSAGGR